MEMQLLAEGLDGRAKGVVVASPGVSPASGPWSYDDFGSLWLPTL